MTPIDCCHVGSSYVATGIRDLASLEAAARQHATHPIDSQSLERELRRRPELVDAWLRYAEDKRWSPAWYFSEDRGKWIAGYLSTDTSVCDKMLYDDRFQACATFIIHELEDYRAFRESKGKW